MELSQSLVRQIFLPLGRKCKSFYLNNYWIGQVAHSLHLFFFQYIVLSEVTSPTSPMASWVSLPLIICNAIQFFFFFFNIVKKQINDVGNEIDLNGFKVQCKPFYLNKTGPSKTLTLAIQNRVKPFKTYLGTLRRKILFFSRFLLCGWVFMGLFYTLQSHLAFSWRSSISCWQFIKWVGQVKYSWSTLIELKRIEFICLLFWVSFYL